MRPILIWLLCLPICLSITAQTVFKTPSGAKYHTATCRMVKNVSQEISIAEAEQLGLTPCKICSPVNIYGSGVPVTHKAKGEGESVQCSGFTKSGARCRHMTRIANGFCFQHQPGN